MVSEPPLSSVKRSQNQTWISNSPKTITDNTQAILQDIPSPVALCTYHLPPLLCLSHYLNSTIPASLERPLCFILQNILLLNQTSDHVSLLTMYLADWAELAEHSSARASQQLVYLSHPNPLIQKKTRDSCKLSRVVYVFATHCRIMFTLLSINLSNCLLIISEILNPFID